MYASKKPAPLFVASTPKICPVCGHSSYSSTGIHPQCAAERADEPRRLKLVAERKAKALLASIKSPKGTASRGTP